jgi:hypothetical protein
MADTNLSGVFVLQEVRERILADVWPKEFVVQAIPQYSWIAGNSGSTTTIERYTLTSDTTSTTNRGLMDYGLRAGRSLGTTSYGWFGGGYAFPGTHYSNVSRIDYSNDNTTTSSRGKVNRGFSFSGSTNTNVYGWFLGGATAPSFSKTSDVSRIEFSTDTATGSARGPLTLARSNFWSSGTESFAWNFGGESPSALVSRIDRITYSSDTAAASSRASLPENNSNSTASSNSLFVWNFGGGLTSRIYRLDVSNDLVSLSNRTTLRVSASGIHSTETTEYSWIGGIGGSSIDRYTFSDDTTQPIFRLNTLITRSQSDATPAGQIT